MRAERKLLIDAADEHTQHTGNSLRVIRTIIKSLYEAVMRKCCSYSVQAVLEMTVIFLRQYTISSRSAKYICSCSLVDKLSETTSLLWNMVAIDGRSQSLP